MGRKGRPCQGYGALLDLGLECFHCPNAGITRLISLSRQILHCRVPKPTCFSKPFKPLWTIMISQFVIGNAVGIGCFTETDWVEP